MAENAQFCTDNFTNVLRLEVLFFVPPPPYFSDETYAPGLNSNQLWGNVLYMNVYRLSTHHYSIAPGSANVSPSWRDSIIATNKWIVLKFFVEVFKNI